MKEDDKSEKSQRPLYRVHRWRLDECPTVSSNVPLHTTSSLRDDANDETVLDAGSPKSLQSQLTDLYQISNTESCISILTPTQNFKLALSTDHILLTLITENVCRAFASNKSLLHFAAIFIETAYDIPVPSDTKARCAMSVMRPSKQKLPCSLEPTQLQMNLPHPSWIDALPFPKMRDNLIRNQSFFDHIAFLEDLVGDAVHMATSDCPRVASMRTERCRQGNNQGQLNDKSLIIWGEPHLKENWEATPRFLTKWAWAAEGCHDLLMISNGWRATRGEIPLSMILNP